MNVNTEKEKRNLMVESMDLMLKVICIDLDIASLQKKRDIFNKRIDEIKEKLKDCEEKE